VERATEGIPHLDIETMITVIVGSEEYSFNVVNNTYITGPNKMTILIAFLDTKNNNRKSTRMTSVHFSHFLQKCS
jgi:hypothetical protein